MTSIATELQQHCELLRSLHRPGDPLLLPNAWDAATARAVVAAGYPVVATTSWGVAASLGFEDGEGAPAAEMLAAAGRIVRSVEVPVTVDAEAGYGMEPAEVVAALLAVGAAGCNLEDTDHARRDAARSRPARDLAQGGVRGCFGGRLPAGRQRPSRQLPRALHRRGADRATSSRWSPTRCSAPTPTSMPGPTACTRSRCGSPTPWIASCRRCTDR